MAGLESEIDKKTAREPERCSLGQWIYSEGQKYMHVKCLLKEMQDLVNKHTDMHAEVGRVLDAMDTDDKETAEKHKNRVNQLSMEIIAIIDLVEQHILKDMRALSDSAQSSALLNINE